jgi:hypothetical protein
VPRNASNAFNLQQIQIPRASYLPEFLLHAASAVGNVEHTSNLTPKTHHDHELGDPGIGLALRQSSSPKTNATKTNSTVTATPAPASRARAPPPEWQVADVLDSALSSSSLCFI